MVFVFARPPDILATATQALSEQSVVTKVVACADPFGDLGVGRGRSVPLTSSPRRLSLPSEKAPSRPDDDALLAEALNT
jgi:hypothetical protein